MVFPLGCSNTQNEMFQLFMAHVLERQLPLSHAETTRAQHKTPNWNCCQLAVVLEGRSIGLTTTSRCALHLVSGTILTGCSWKDVVKKNVGKGWKAVFTIRMGYPPGNDHISFLGKRKIIDSKVPWEKGYIPGRVKCDFKTSKRS